MALRPTSRRFIHALSLLALVLPLLAPAASRADPVPTQAQPRSVAAIAQATVQTPLVDTQDQTAALFGTEASRLLASIQSNDPQAPELPAQPLPVPDQGDAGFPVPDARYFYYHGQKPVVLKPIADLIVVGFVNAAPGKQEALEMLEDVPLEVVEGFGRLDVLNTGQYRIATTLAPVEFDGVVSRLLARRDVRFVSPVFQDGADGTFYFTDDLFVSFRADTPSSVAERVLAKQRLEVVREFVSAAPEGRILLARLATDDRRSVLEVANALNQLEAVFYSHPDFIRRHNRLTDNGALRLTAEASSLSSYQKPWFIAKVGAEDAWEQLARMGKAKYSMKVAVIDTGVQRAHDDLSTVRKVLRI